MKIIKKYILAMIPILAASFSYAQNTAWPSPASNNNVGIGTTTANQKLTINGGGIGFDWNSSDKKLYSPADGDLEWVTQNGAGVHGFAVSNNGNRIVYLNTNGNSYLNGGNVGIGTISPGSLLQVNGITSIRDNVATDGYISISPGDPISQGYINWWKPGNIRVGYMGYTDAVTANNLALTLEASANFIINGGNVGIGTTRPDQELTVNGKIHATEVLVDANVRTPDYVFDKDYGLASLKDVKTYIDQNHHLPEIPSAAQVATDGINLGEMNMKLLKKIEELTLYLIDLKDANEKLNLRVQNLESKR